MGKVVDDFDFSIRKPFNKEWLNGQTWELSAEDFISKDRIPANVEYFLKMKARTFLVEIRKTDADGNPVYEFDKVQTRVKNNLLYVKAVNSTS